ncbi:MAG: hypothetical protein K6F27_10165 [Ruminococcus sp.]|nr:hypothetical protein [Ruminococcus sp.]
MKGAKNEVYKQSITSQEAWQYIKAVLFPILMLLLSMYSISTFSQFGLRLIAPLTAVMWVIGVLIGLIMPAMRKEVLNQTLVFIGCYQLALLGWREAIKLVSNVTSEQIMASYNQVITMSQSSAIPGYLQNALWMTAIGVPIGYIGMQGKRLFQFKKKMSKDKALRQYRSIR